jgi:hypothetical protein
MPSWTHNVGEKMLYSGFICVMICKSTIYRYMLQLQGCPYAVYRSRYNFVDLLFSAAVWRQCLAFAVAEYLCLSWPLSEKSGLCLSWTFPSSFAMAQGVGYPLWMACVFKALWYGSQHRISLPFLSSREHSLRLEVEIELSVLFSVANDSSDEQYAGLRCPAVKVWLDMNTWWPWPSKK